VFPKEGGSKNIPERGRAFQREKDHRKSEMWKGKEGDSRASVREIRSASAALDGEGRIRDVQEHGEGDERKDPTAISGDLKKEEGARRIREALSAQSVNLFRRSHKIL